jgi:hypothetical protein
LYTRPYDLFYGSLIAECLGFWRRYLFGDRM